MKNRPFRFQQFTVRQEHAAMKVGTDGVLLAAWAPSIGSGRILDIGTGTGVTALILAQRNPDGYILAIDANTSAAREAADNFKESPWPSRLTSVHVRLQDITFASAGAFDLIVCNPPFFTEQAHVPASGTSRKQARSDGYLSLSELLADTAVLLRSTGVFCLILPADREIELMETAGRSGLFLHRITRVRSLAGKPSHRILCRLGKLPVNAREEDELVLLASNRRNDYTEAHSELVSDLYIRQVKK